MNHSLITEYFEADHNRLDSLFKQFQASKGDMKAAKIFFRPFLRGLKRHIVWEEEVLFPLFEKRSGMPPTAGPTAVMRHEHRLIEAALERIHDFVRRQDPAGGPAEAELLATLSGHNDKEEQVLYPAIDQRVSEAEAAEAFARMEAIPPERWEVCGCSHPVERVRA